MYEVIVDGNSVCYEQDRSTAHAKALEETMRILTREGIYVEWEVKEVRL